MRTVPEVNRREAVRRLALLAAGVAATGCTPLRVVLRLYPDEFDSQPEMMDRVLRAFVVTVIPGAPIEDPQLVRAYYDPYYPLAKYTDFLASDLSRRAEQRFGTAAFDRLTVDERARVIQDGLEADRITARLYNGAIFLAQVSFYGGIYDDAKGCSLIGFEGRYRFRGVDAITHPEPERFFARSISSDGNPA